LNNPSCDQCDHVFYWPTALKQLFALKRPGTAMWGAVCPDCGADLKVPNSRAMLIFAAAIFFGSQTSTLMVLGTFTKWEFWLAKLFMILGYYAIAIFFLMKFESVQKEEPPHGNL
jgi:hypothetical protein